MIVEVFRLRIPDLFIMDAVVGMEGNGPASPRGVPEFNQSFKSCLSASGIDRALTNGSRFGVACHGGIRP